MSVLLVDRTPIELRIGRVEDGAVTRLHHEYPSRGELRLGALVRARVERFEPRLGGAFCTVAGRDAFLPVPKGKPPARGSMMLASVRREAIGEKAAQIGLNAALHLPGITVFEGEDGFVFKPGPLTVPETEKASRREAAERMAKAVFAEGEEGVLGSPDPLIRSLMNVLDAGTREVHVTDPDLVPLLNETLAPLGIEVVAGNPRPLRSALDEAEEGALARTAPLPGGGRIVFDETEALTAIDVDLGRQDGRSKKGAAARATEDVFASLDRQSALRSLGGQIVLDLPRAAIRSPKIVRERLSKALSHGGRPSVPAVTGEGICVAIAPRSVPSLLERLTEASGGDVRPGRRLRSDVLAARAYRALEAALLADRSAQIRLTCAERAAPYLEASAPALAGRYGPRFRVEPAPMESFDVR
ncbi:ribonuclease E/G [Parvularcula dongshanensis]|uniref:Ribonuclease G/E n=1 Tax=Parvularcula dongshanensis TaxID=1173995 RepID=A0A840I562_9PROT|nr:ribonuclease E/G [Parvularcula dongshanensis]MBB4659421.1 Ribonuclease G/E [Parvularcula dongshanensis]